MKKNILYYTAIAGLVPSGVLCNTLDLKESEQTKPNIIYILADDLGYAELGCFGQEKIETPNIDQLAAEGMRFTNHYSGQAVSGPSRCSLFTGLHSGHAYIRGNDPVASRGDVWNYRAMVADSTLEGQRPVPANTIMIPRKLKEAGYATACIGKWGLGWPGSESTPNKMGFDFFYGYNCQRMAHTYYPPFLYRNESREYIDNELVVPGTKLDEGADVLNEENYRKFTQSEYTPDLMYHELLNFVEHSASEPFALFWTTPVPHVPLQAPERWVKYYVDKWGDEKPYLGEAGYYPCRYPHATYAAMISYWDEQIGGLVRQLKELGIYENTVIIFTSDNGPTFNGGADSPYFDSAKPFKSEAGWGKANLREGGIRVPMIAVWPGHIESGVTSDLLSAFWDMMPTMCEIAGVDCPPTDGISMLPEMTGKTEQQKKHEFLYWEFPESGGQRAVRMGEWKAFVGDIKKGNRNIELYNLTKDPREQQDVSSEHPDLVEKALNIFRSQHTEPVVEGFRMPVW
ncbi:MULTISPECIES: arylsulfatase [Parabacteroides]|uniref:arylsulfatase n=1 Tax=Parabacteroides TaxID=375288 RepID=UPI000EFF9693|nr:MULTISPECIES: arylsulfatase [Parabacteroides]RHU25308.1 N-acetylgalactosamine-6-sulfatase [Parabacteroides sp. TM07-1AC]WFE85240.1 arylsulfatase [Parabacteroides chongii]